MSGVDLVQWLTAQFDEDERIAREADTSPEMVTGIPGSYAQAPVALHIARFADPARVLREIDAKRQVVERYEQAMENRRAHPEDLASAGALLALHGAVKLLALPYADRPGYAEALASAE